MNENVFATTVTITIDLENCEADKYGDYLADYLDRVIAAARASSAGVEVKRVAANTSSSLLEGV